jgi:hypothetical protein
MPYADYEVAKTSMRTKYQNLSPEEKKQHSLACSSRRRKRRQKLVEQFGNKCVKCGFDDPRALQFDHINSDSGGKNRDYDRNKLWNEIEETPERFQLLCANCNTIKRFECNELN